MRNTNYLIGILILLLVSVGISGDERDIPISEIPGAVLKAAQEALPGVQFTEAEMEESNDGITYELEGIKGDFEYEIELTAEGIVLEIEQERDADDHSGAHTGDHGGDHSSDHDSDHSGDHDGDHTGDHDQDHDLHHEDDHDTEHED